MDAMIQSVMRIFSGIQPSGNLHIGNYLGSILQWVELLENSPNTEGIFCIVDLHTITVKQDPKVLKEKIYELAAIYLAAGIDYKRNIIFAQSQNPDHTYCAWLFNCITPIGWLNRMTQFKDKRAKLENYGNIVSTGLLTYPSLMAADILLYDTDIVPVGGDQAQHVELTRSIGQRFNRLYGRTFKIPTVKVNEITAYIMDLQEPTKKMSKSDTNPKGKINLLATEKEILDNIKKAVTDTDNSVRYDVRNKAGISNLIVILSSIEKISIQEIEAKYSSSSYSTFKNDVANSVLEFLLPLQKKTKEYLSDKAELERILRLGTEKSYKISHPKLLEVCNKMGLFYNE